MSVEQLTAFLLGQPAAVETLLAQHVDDGRGHCRACGLGQRGYLTWPCTIHTAAARAAGHESRSGGTENARLLAVITEIGT